MSEETTKMFVGIDTSKNNQQVSFLNPTEVKKEIPYHKLCLNR